MPSTENSPAGEHVQTGLPVEEKRVLCGTGKRDSEESGPLRSFLEFSLGGQWYAVDLGHARRILRPSPIARVPGAPSEVVGLMNRAGEVLAVLDLEKAMGMKGEVRGPREEGGFVLVLHLGGKEAGLLVDAVEDTWEIPVDKILPVLETVDSARARFFEGTVARDGRFVGILNVSICLNP